MVFLCTPDLIDSSRVEAIGPRIAAGYDLVDAFPELGARAGKCECSWPPGDRCGDATLNLRAHAFTSQAEGPRFGAMQRRAPYPTLITAAALGLLVQACDNAPKAAAHLSVKELSAAADSRAPQGSSRYIFDHQSSKVTWVGAKVTGKHDGSFERFTGNIDLVGDSPEKGTATGTAID